MPDRDQTALPFTLESAIHLHRFSFDCIEREYPSKPGHVLESDGDLRPPREVHPSFHGCYDWHSAVHGHWTLVTILHWFPEFPRREAVLAKLQRTITAANIRAEVRFFEERRSHTFERPYGWAWLLKLAEALRDWSDPAAVQMRRNLLPLERLLAGRMEAFLEVLDHPVRVGTHANTAFAMSLAHEYAVRHSPSLAHTIERRARAYFLDDRACPLTWEPGGFDFLSPCLQEAALMATLLPETELSGWLDGFLPGFGARPGRFLAPVEVADPSDGHLAHLDGLNFSRASCLFEIGKRLGNQEMIALGVRHFQHSWARLDASEYAGSHWLATFATHALINR